MPITDSIETATELLLTLEKKSLVSILKEQEIEITKLRTEMVRLQTDLTVALQSMLGQVATIAKALAPGNSPVSQVATTDPAPALEAAPLSQLERGGSFDLVGHQADRPNVPSSKRGT